MSNGTSTQPLATTGTEVAGIMCPWNPKYPPSVTLGQGGYPAPEDGPTAVPPGCAPGLPTLVFAGAWQH
jgi:hypothetical protein